MPTVINQKEVKQDYQFRQNVLLHIREIAMNVTDASFIQNIQKVKEMGAAVTLQSVVTSVQQVTKI